MNCKVAVSLMHDYLDNDLSKPQQLELKAHMVECTDCRNRLEELEKTDMLLFSLTHHATGPSEDLTERIMGMLPKEKKQKAWVTWVKRHPAITAAALFLVVMLFSTVSFWDQNNQLVVRGTELDKLVIKGQTVIIPPDQTITGDITVENGKTEVFGQVEGNLTVIDGELFQASTAYISGQVKDIDKAMDWIWYKITNLFTDVAYR
ncbi:zf-HC2 domain-containing protein [Paenibacillus sp. F411]|uniref:zf-HC2 domain-containing protein n=1 Tax=unclassified Paenibacillus TaxID=185978 RepID=UPI001AAE6D18|nr:zf-HC2 domain-containing protein [Paenibacillus sp. F411]MBO2946238.1 zf-HC2 domain-containing protein [Paenibacillus sp. F411]